MTIEKYLQRQMEFSLRTFGPGKRTKGVTEHIAKELAEIRNSPDDLREWIDVIILGLDGFWRAGGGPFDLMHLLTEKQEKNMRRQWPESSSEDEAIEHVRGVHD